MTLSEFRYWLRGYATQIKNAPTPEQWKFIQDKLEEFALFSKSQAITPGQAIMPSPLREELEKRGIL